MPSIDCQIAPSDSLGELFRCFSRLPLGSFARDVRALLRNSQNEPNLSDVLVNRSAFLVKEEEEINSSKNIILHTYDKLRAEITRVEAQMREQDRRLQEVTQQKKLCKVALNMLVSGDVPNLVDSDGTAPTSGDERSRNPKQVPENPKDEDDDIMPSKSAPEPSPVKSALRARTPTSTTKGNSAALAASPRAAVSGTSLIAMLSLPDVNESALLNAIETYELQTFNKSNSWMTTEGHADVLTVLLALLRHLPEPRPPIQLAEIHILNRVLQAQPASSTTHNKNLMAMLEALVKKGDAVRILSGLLSSVNDDVKCEVLECLSPLICGSHALVATFPKSDLSGVTRQEFLRERGLEPLVNIVVCSTSEAVLERALVFLWGLLSKDEKSDVENNGGKSIRTQVRELGGLRAVLDLLYTDSLAILENVCMVIGYITREDVSKKEIREIGGLEKITATLRHPSDSIKTKMAGAVWNCASNADNRSYLRNLGAIPALLELLRQPSDAVDPSAYEFVRENAAGALWNLSVDAENKAMILDYGGIPALVQVIASSSSVAVVENVSGTLWNCSAAVETRPLIRKAGGIPILLGLLDDNKETSHPTSEKILDNAAGTLRNCAINDQNKPAIQNAGGVELLLRRIKESLSHRKGEEALSQSTIDKLASTLWILTISPDIKQTVRTAGGIETVIGVLEASSPTLTAAAKSKSKSLFPPVRLTVPYTTVGEYEKNLYSPAILSKIPSSAPSLAVNMNVKEKLVGVLRNCSTITENRAALVKCGAVSALVAVVLDCYSSHSIFLNTPAHKNGSRFSEPSVQLKETVASALWYLARDDKVAPREQGGLELMCMFLVSGQQPSVVLEQAAGALSSMSVSNTENRDAIRTFGGLLSLVALVAEKATVEYPRRDGGHGNKIDNAPHTYAVLNALLTIRNCTGSNEENAKFCGELSLLRNGEFAGVLLYIVENGSEEGAREAALTLKNICASPKVQEHLNRHGGVKAVNSFSERASSDSARKAAASALQALSRKR
ncbi:vacuolar protein 8 [Strigomonas culicis]|uniref:Vacuolar protein 8 n=1 Tax=Strigomonas culicis TaxID=28005 RepID=S9UDP5_9TRYP|nr:vacuolar protein 8 [Strigomonas culicis]|eukprot:EPY26864.1 vacuolar protein 8 [Strigomonas culicis]